VTVVVSQKGWVRARTGHGHDAAGFAFKAGDGLYGTFECRTVDPLIVCGSNGRVYSVPVSALPGARGDGAPITSLVEMESGTQILHYLAGPAEQMLLLAHSGGTGLLARLGDLVTRQKGGKGYFTLEAGEQWFLPVKVAPHHTQIACLAGGGRLLVFGLGELKHQPNGGRGLMLMEVDAAAGDPLLAVVPFSAGLRIAGVGRGAKARQEDLRPGALAAFVGRRARKGKAIDTTMQVQMLMAL
jgi:topoisomerase-4 subunit A